jgi:hypothetical protein
VRYKFFENENYLPQTPFTATMEGSDQNGHSFVLSVDNKAFYHLTFE